MKRTRYKSVGRRAVVISVAAALAACGFFIYGRTDRSLTHVGRRVASLDSVPPYGEPIPIGGLKGNKLLVCYYDSSGFARYCVIDTQSGVKTMMPKLNDPIENSDRIVSGSLSPDGLWMQYDQPNVNAIMAERVDGSQVVRWPVHSSGPSWWVWSRGSNGGAEIDVSAGQLYKHSLSGSKTPRVVKVHPWPKESARNVYPIGQTADGYLLYDQASAGGGDLNLMRLGEEGDLHALGTFKTPREGICSSLGLSPSGRKLLWMVSYETKPSPSALIRRIHGWLHITQGAFDSLWVSDSDGRNPHEVGYLRTDDQLTDRGLLFAGWMQNEKHLWFEHEKSLWIVPVE